MHVHTRARHTRVCVCVCVCVCWISAPYRALSGTRIFLRWKHVPGSEAGRFNPSRLRSRSASASSFSALLAAARSQLAWDVSDPKLIRNACSTRGRLEYDLRPTLTYPFVSTNFVPWMAMVGVNGANCNDTRTALVTAFELLPLSVCVCVCVCVIVYAVRWAVYAFASIAI